jgi:hypothetical protein
MVAGNLCEAAELILAPQHIKRCEAVKVTR